MDRTAVFVDAGYLFAQGSVAPSGKKLSRGHIEFDAEKAAKALSREESQNLFQSTRLREARPGITFLSLSPSKFQSTRLREARRQRGRTVRVRHVFQSTRLREARLGATENPV